MKLDFNFYPIKMTFYTTNSIFYIKLLKFEDDITLTGLISGGDEYAYRWEIFSSGDLVQTEQLGAKCWTVEMVVENGDVLSAAAEEVQPAKVNDCALLHCHY